MKTIIPPPLQPGDEIRVIAPSLFFKHNLKEDRKLLAAKTNMQKHFGHFKLTFGSNCKKRKKADTWGSSSIAERLYDLEEAFSDKKVKAIIPITGGYNANQLLPKIDYQLIKKNKKIFCGYSDITVLNNAIYARTGLITFSGPNWSNFGRYKNLVPFTINNFIASINAQKNCRLPFSEKWLDNSPKKEKGQLPAPLLNKGPQLLNSTKTNVSGTLMGGNLCSFNLLQGTPYMPNLKNSILFIEDDQIFEDTKTFLREFERNLVSLIQQPGFEQVQGLLIGRFEKKSGITIKMLKEIIETKPELRKIPVIANLDFGHTSPMLTLPIGRTAQINMTGNKTEIVLI